MLELELTPEDNLLIIGSDGLWDVGQHGQARRPGSDRAGHLRLGAPSLALAHARTSGHKSRAMAAWGLQYRPGAPEAPHKAPVSLRVAIQVLDDARIVHCCRNTAKSPDMIAKRLLGEALDRGTTDNVTVVVVFLRDLT